MCKHSGPGSWFIPQKNNNFYTVYCTITSQEYISKATSELSRIKMKKPPLFTKALLYKKYSQLQFKQRFHRIFSKQ